MHLRAIVISQTDMVFRRSKTFFLENISLLNKTQYTSTKIYIVTRLYITNQMIIMECKKKL